MANHPRHIKKEYYTPERHNFYKQLFEKEEDLIYHQQNNPKSFRQGDRIWNPSSARYSKKQKGKRVGGDSNLTSELFPLRRGTFAKTGKSVARRGVGGDPLPPTHPSAAAAAPKSRAASRSALGASALMSSRSRARGGGLTGRSSVSRASLGSARTGRTDRTGTSRSLLSTGRSVSTEIITELRDRKAKLLEELHDLEDLEKEAIELQTRRTARSGFSSVSGFSRGSRRSAR